MYHTIAAIALARHHETAAIRHGAMRRRTRARRRLPALPGPRRQRLDVEPLPPGRDVRLHCFARAGTDLGDLARRWYGDPAAAATIARANRLPPGRLPRSLVLRLPLLPEPGPPAAMRAAAPRAA